MKLKRFRRTIKTRSEINVTPLVDVMLVLLVIFMVTSPMLVSGVHVDLPKTSTSPVSGQDEPLAITIDKEGVIYLQEVAVLPLDLIPKLRAITGEKRDTRIFVRGDRDASYGKVVELMASIGEAGFSKVALVTEIHQP